MYSRTKRVCSLITAVLLFLLVILSVTTAVSALSYDIGAAMIFFAIFSIIFGIVFLILGIKLSLPPFKSDGKFKVLIPTNIAVIVFCVLFALYSLISLIVLAFVFAIIAAFSESAPSDYMLYLYLINIFVSIITLIVNITAMLIRARKE